MRANDYMTIASTRCVSLNYRIVASHEKLTRFVSTTTMLDGNSNFQIFFVDKVESTVLSSTYHSIEMQQDAV